MAVNAQQLPIAAVGRIVVVVVVLVVNGQLPQSLARKLATAARADMREELQRTLPIGSFPEGPFAPGRGYNRL
jgi:hypothetical protein